MVAQTVEIIHAAKNRLWFASPYFVPEQAVRTAIAHAAIRGVDVRIARSCHARVSAA